MGLGNSFMKTVTLVWKTFTKMENLLAIPEAIADWVAERGNFNVIKS